MSLKEQLTKPKPLAGRNGPRCSVGYLLATLPPSEAKALTVMLDAPWRVWPHSDIERALREEGHDVGGQQVGRHRRGICKCQVAGA